jgi:hypothetical protein
MGVLPLVMSPVSTTPSTGPVPFENLNTGVATKRISEGSAPIPHHTTAHTASEGQAQATPGLAAGCHLPRP